MITSDEYVVDVPLGFTAMIIADPSSRQISIVGTNPPPQNVIANVTQGENVNMSIAPPPITPTSYASYGSLLNMVILTAMFIGIGLMAFRFSGEPAIGLITPALVGVIVFAVLQNWAAFFTSLVVMVVGFAARVASKS